MRAKDLSCRRQWTKE